MYSCKYMRLFSTVTFNSIFNIQCVFIKDWPYLKYYRKPRDHGPSGSNGKAFSIEHEGPGLLAMNTYYWITNRTQDLRFYSECLTIRTTALASYSISSALINLRHEAIKLYYWWQQFHLQHIQCSIIFNGISAKINLWRIQFTNRTYLYRTSSLKKYIR